MYRKPCTFSVPHDTTDSDAYHLTPVILLRKKLYVRYEQKLDVNSVQFDTRLSAISVMKIVDLRQDHSKSSKKKTS